MLVSRLLSWSRAGAYARSATLAVLMCACVALPAPAQTALVVDPSLAPELLDRTRAVVSDALELPDGHFLIAGAFTIVDGAPRAGVARIDAAGRVDPTFKALNIVGSVERLARVPTGGYYLVGRFSEIDGAATSMVARVSAAGEVDPSFVSRLVSVTSVRTVSVAADGGLFIVADSISVPGGAIANVVKLDATGALAAGFTPVGSAVSTNVSAAFLPDGRFFITGTMMSSLPVSDRVQRFRPDGTRDMAFDFATLNTSMGVHHVVAQPDGKVILGGFASVPQGEFMVRVNLDGTRDTSFQAFSVEPVHGSLASVLLSDGSIIITPIGGSITPPALARVDASGVLMGGFSIGQGPDSTTGRVVALTSGDFLYLGRQLAFDSADLPNVTRVGPTGASRSTPRVDLGASARVETVAALPDGRLWVGGSITGVGGVKRHALVALDSSGGLATGVLPSVADGSVSHLVPVTGGWVAIGTFSGMTGAHTGEVARLRADGSVDTQFLAGATLTRGGVKSATSFPDGSVVLGGTFVFHVNQSGFSHVARVRTDGTFDPAWGLAGGDSSRGPSENVASLGVDLSSRLILHGSFNTIRQTDRPGLARVMSDGTLDTAFAPVESIRPLGTARLTVLPDHRVLLVGTPGSGASRLYRIQANGTLDDGFQPALPNLALTNAFLAESDGSVLVGYQDNASPRRTRVRRVLPDGSLDPAFVVDLGTAGPVRALVRDAAGHLVLGGHFTEVNGVARNGLARLAPSRLFASITGVPTRYIAADAGAELQASVSGATGAVQYEWRRDGTPVVGATQQALSVTGFSVEKAGSYTVRVTDSVSSFVSAPVVLALPVAPAITRQPLSRQEGVGGAVVLRVEASGLPVPTYQWLRNGVAIVGEVGAELILRGVTSADAGSYSVRVSNAGGAIESAAAVLTVAPVGVDPLFSPHVSWAYQSTPPVLIAGAADGSVMVSSASELVMGRRVGPGPLRLRPDLQVDPAFDGTQGGTALLVLPDGSFVSRVSTGESGGALRRLSATGAVDPGFAFNTGSSTVLRAASAPGGKLVIGASSFTRNGSSVPGLARLNADGSWDTTFVPGVTGGFSVFAVSPDGHVWVHRSGGSPSAAIVRLTAGGAIASGTPEVSTGFSTVSDLVALDDGSVVAVGSQLMIGGQTRNGYCRVRVDGTVDANFSGFGSSGFEVLAARLVHDGRLVLAGNGVSPSQRVFHAVVPAGGGAAAVTFHDVITGITGSRPGVAIQSDGGALFAGELLTLGGVNGPPVRSIAGMLRLRPDGTVDMEYDGSFGTVGYVTLLHAMPRGRWLVGGFFDAVGGRARDDIAVVGADGRCEESFKTSDFYSATPYAAAVLGDESIVLAGSFIEIRNGASVSRSIVHVRADGRLSTSLDPHFPPGFNLSPRICALPDGRFLVSEKSMLDQRPGASRITRFNADFSIDTTFDVKLTFSPAGMLVLPDASILVSSSPGTFVTDATGATRSGLVRLLASGLIDTAFNPPALSVSVKMAPAPGGDIVIWGGFMSLGGQARIGIARLKADGSVDPAFVPPATGPRALGATDVAVAPDGKVIVVGGYYWLGGGVVPSSVIARLNTDGTLDPSLNLPVSNRIDSAVGRVATRANGDIVVGGRFHFVGTSERSSLARITTNHFQAHTTRSELAVPLGGEGFVDVALIGAAFPEVRWFHEGVLRPGADRPVLVLRDFKTSDAGRYHAEVMAGGALVRTDPVMVRVREDVTVDPVSALTFSESGGVGGLFVNAPPATPWSVPALPAWIQTGTTSGSGTGTLAFTIAPNIAGPPRSAVLEVAGQAFTVSQSGVSSRLANISTRGRSGTGDDTMIVGFVTSGDTPLAILGRGVGPTLGALGVGGVVPDPTLRLVQGMVDVRLNNDWDTGADRDTILAESRRVGAFDLLANAGDAALVASLAPGAYTMLLGDTASRAGVALAELYDRTPPAEAGWRNRVLNLSTRGWVGNGDEVLIAGFVVTGPAHKQVLIRGVGPTLGTFGVQGVLADPFVRLVRDGETILANDDWGTSEKAGVILRAAQVAGAFPLSLDSRDAGALVSLAPGAYTVVLSGADNGRGVALLEVYDLE